MNNVLTVALAALLAAVAAHPGTILGDGPPPTGTPIGILMGADGTPRSLTPGDQAAAALAFDDTQRMP